MNAPGDSSSVTRETLCEHEMVEQLNLVASYADIARQMLLLDDKPGVDYALRRMATAAKAAIGARNHQHADDAAGGA
jgi:hypothetical protein